MIPKHEREDTVKNRRSFLKMVSGFAIGTGAVISGIPWSVIPEKEVKKLKELKGRELLVAKTDALAHPTTDYMIVVIDDKGTHIWAPSVKSFETYEDRTVFYAEDIMIDKHMTLISAKLVSKDSAYVGEEPFPAPIAACPNDILKLSFTMRYHG